MTYSPSPRVNSPNAVGGRVIEIALAQNGLEMMPTPKMNHAGRLQSWGPPFARICSVRNFFHGMHSSHPGPVR